MRNPGKRGRPRQYEHRVPVPYTTEQLELIDRIADRVGLTRAAWIRSVTLDAADKAEKGVR